MGKINDLPYYRDIGHGCYTKHLSGKSPDIVYHDDVTGCTRRRDSRRVWGGVCLLSAAVIIIILLLTS